MAEWGRVIKRNVGSSVIIIKVANHFDLVKHLVEWCIKRIEAKNIVQRKPQVSGTCSYIAPLMKTCEKEDNIGINIIIIYPVPTSSHLAEIGTNK